MDTNTAGFLPECPNNMVCRNLIHFDIPPTNRSKEGPGRCPMRALQKARSSSAHPLRSRGRKLPGKAGFEFARNLDTTQQYFGPSPRSPPASCSIVLPEVQYFECLVLQWRFSSYCDRAGIYIRDTAQRTPEMSPLPSNIT